MAFGTLRRPTGRRRLPKAYLQISPLGQINAKWRNPLTCFRVLGLSGSLRRNHKKLSRSPYPSTLKFLACQENYGGITKNGGYLRTDLHSSSWLVRKITEESQKTEHISVPTCFQALGLSQSLRRNHKKLSIPPYQPAFGSLACQDRYGENAKNWAYLRTDLLSGP